MTVVPNDHHFNLPLQITGKNEDKEGRKPMNNLSCIMEDGETSTLMQSQRKLMVEQS